MSATQQKNAGTGSGNPHAQTKAKLEELDVKVNVMAKQAACGSGDRDGNGRQCLAWWCYRAVMGPFTYDMAQDLPANEGNLNPQAAAAIQQAQGPIKRHAVLADGHYGCSDFDIECVDAWERSSKLENSSILLKPWHKMGCERVREAGNLGFGGVRASMERRWLINAKTTVMRQRKWQEVRLQKELDEQRKKADILERRKRERARLSAYIHSAVQPPVKCSTTGKHKRNGRKTLDWKTCLLRDQDLILKLRENAKAVAHNYPSKGGSSNSEREVPGHYTCRTACRDSRLVQVSASPSRFGAQDLCLKRNIDDSIQLLEMPATCAEAIAYTPLLEKDSHNCVNEMMQLPRTGSVRSETAVSTSGTSARNTIRRETNFAEDHQSPIMLEMINWRSSTADKHNGLQLERTVLLNSEDAGPRVATEITGCCAEKVKTNGENASLEIASFGKRESVMRRCSPNLKEEILRSRLGNEAATTRLIAQVTAIESRLDDCNMNWKSLCLRNDEIDVFPATGPAQILCADVHPVHLNLVTKTNRQFSLDAETGPKNASRVNGIGIKINKQDFSSVEGQQSDEHVRETRLFLSCPRAEVSDGISFHSTVSSSSLENRRAETTHRGQGEFESGGLRPFKHSHKNSAAFSFEQESSNGWGTTSFQEKKITNIELAEQMKYRPERSSICHESGLETSVISGLLRFDKNSSSSRVNVSRQGDAEAQEDSIPRPPKIVGNACDIVAMKDTFPDSMKESHAAWNIDWNAATDLFPMRSWEDLQSMQCRHCSSMSNLANINRGGEQSYHQSQVSHHVYEPGQQKIPCFLGCGCNRPDSLHTQRDEDRAPAKLEGSKCSHFPAFETSGSVRISSDLESGRCFQDQYTCQDTNSAQSAGFGAPLVSGNGKQFENVGPHSKYSPGDKEAPLESRRQSLLEEEQKIFASLERLDWKLAAINLRSMNVGRESTLSQGQYSTKSAPAIMGSPPRTIMEHFSMAAKKAVPYSAMPPRPSVSSRTVMNV